jgi:hypothetical protein
MDPIDRQLSSFLLAQIEWQLKKISAQEQRLARRKALLLEKRLGCSSAPRAPRATSRWGSDGLVIVEAQKGGFFVKGTAPGPGQGTA